MGDGALTKGGGAVAGTADCSRAGSIIPGSANAAVPTRAASTSDARCTGGGGPGTGAAVVGEGVTAGFRRGGERDLRALEPSGWRRGERALLSTITSTITSATRHTKLNDGRFDSQRNSLGGTWDAYYSDTEMSEVHENAERVQTEFQKALEAGAAAPVHRQKSVTNLLLRLKPNKHRPNHGNRVCVFRAIPHSRCC
jgi:hypothetical protein